MRVFMYNSIFFFDNNENENISIKEKKKERKKMQRPKRKEMRKREGERKIQIRLHGRSFDTAIESNRNQFSILSKTRKYCL